MKKIIIVLGVFCVIGGGAWWHILHHKGAVIQKTIQSVDHVLKLEQLDESTRAQFGVIQDIANAMLVQDDVTRRYLVLLQNNLELRPGGGFIGQYAVAEIKNGEVLSFAVKDANVLDGTYKSDRALPEKLQKYLIGTRKWKFRDSNYSPHYPENVENALHFYGLSGNDAHFDGVFAVNATLFEDVLAVTGPITLTKKDWEKYGAFTHDGALMKLEKIVEEPFFRAEERKACEKKLKKAQVPEDDDRWEACQYDENGKKKKKVTHGQRAARKDILDTIMTEMLPQLMKIENIEPLILLATKALDHKDIQLWFQDEQLQQLARAEGWTGEVDHEWNGDYVMISDTNVGALKSDYYMKRTLAYTIDFTGKSAEANDVAAGRMVRYIGDDVKEQVMSGTFVTQLPLATVRMTYENTATESSYYNSDYHSFTRLYVPKGSTWYVREWFEPPGVDTEDIFGGNKQVYGYKFDVLLGDTIPTMLQYTLPRTITEDSYTLKVQKQSGIGTIPLTVTVITSDGVKHVKEVVFEHDMVFALQDGELVVVSE